MVEKDLYDLPLGTVFEKGNKQKVFIGKDDQFVYYKELFDEYNNISEEIDIFLLWIKDAKMID